MDPHFYDRLTAQAISIDGRRQSLNIAHAQVDHFYLPIARWILAGRNSGVRQIVAVAGPPGSGKTTFSAILTAVLNALSAAELAVMVSQDGWHFPNTFLESHTIEHNGQVVSLRSLKGVPESFDVTGFQAALGKMRAGDALCFPVYNRQTHEPIPNAGQVERSHQVILVEGNYLLLDCDPWRSLHALFDLKIFIRMPEELLLDSLRRRHIRGGKERAAVEEQIVRVDRPNIELVCSSSIQADLLVEKDADQNIRALHYTGDASSAAHPGAG